MACGGKGVISVLSNLLPRETSQLCHKALAGDFAGAMEMQKAYLPLINALFCEVNPIPAKAAMAAMGYGENYLRLPLVPMEEAHRQVLLECMRNAGIEVTI
jgi:4-hydroxy-tetrahydrodipicolinate synthase